MPLLHIMVSPDEDKALRPLIEWMDAQGEQWGFRKPNVRERARNMGMEG